METQVLEKIGLTRNESLVYIALLRLGTSKTGEILKKSGLNSGKIYEILESLKTKGLVSESIINNTRHFTASSPSQIKEYLEKKKQGVIEDERTINSILPQLQKIRNITSKEVKAITYTGFKGIKTAVEEAAESLKPGEEALALGVTEHKDKKFNKFWTNWARERMHRKIYAKHIFSERSEYFNIFKKMKYTEVRVLTAVTPVTVDIFGNDKVLILNYQEPTSCILIYDKNTTTTFRTFFDSLWKIAKP